MTATDWEQLLFTALTTAGTSLYTLIGARVYPLDMPQGGTLPAIVYQIISNPEEWNHHGVARVQLSAYATTYSGAKAVQKAARDRLRDYAVASVTDRIEDINTDDAGVPDYDPLTGLHVRHCDVKILHIYRS